MQQAIANPLREGLRQEWTPQPFTMVIFGVSGDLARRMLLPALYNLALDRRLPSSFAVIGVARRQWDDQAFREEALAAVKDYSRRPVDQAVWDSFAQGLFFCPGDFSEPEDYPRLKEVVAKVDKERCACGNRIFYLATPPSGYATIIDHLGAAGLATQGEETDKEGSGWARVIIEKPFGHDLASAQALNARVRRVFPEGQVYRIDHYLGKETVQNIFVFRFANGIFEPIWNHRYIDHVQITAAESIGVERRAGYYEEAGALRDMVQNHLLQLMSLVAMEPPIAFEADAVRDEKVKVLRAIRPVRNEDVAKYTARGQYQPGWVDGHQVPGYRDEEGVRPKSTVETYVALKLFVDNWRWADVPFYLRTGKRLPKRATDVAIHFKRAPHLLFRHLPEVGLLEPNVLTMRIQPNEGISLMFHAKVPGTGMQMRSVNMDFDYGSSFAVQPPSSYETLLLDCMEGDSTLFARRDVVEAAWALVTDILEGWAELPPPSFPNYEAGSWGPHDAELLIERDGRRWHRP